MLCITLTDKVKQKGHKDKRESECLQEKVIFGQMNAFPRVIGTPFLSVIFSLV